MIKKPSEYWFWNTLNRNYIMDTALGWWDTYHRFNTSNNHFLSLSYPPPIEFISKYTSNLYDQSLLDFWYTTPITLDEYLIRANNSSWCASRDATKRRLWHPFGRYRYQISFTHSLYLSIIHHPFYINGTLFLSFLYHSFISFILWLTG